MSRVAKWKAIAVLLPLIFFSACGEKPPFLRESHTESFQQDLNPEFLDILWMVDDRSPMHRIAPELTAEASRFFTRLDAAAHRYRMAFVNHDMELSHGDLKPKNNPVILTKDFGSLENRVQLFESVINQVLINLHTGAINQGFESVRTALTTSFVPRAGVPLVIVFISDSDDHSTQFPISQDAVQFYANSFRAIKENNPDLLRVYSVNYVAGGERCATEYNADIDRGGFQDRYFRLATALNGETGDLCGSFADQIDLSGLRLKTLRSRFQLDGSARPESVQVNFVNPDGSQTTPTNWIYNATTREIIFTEAPAEGVVITVTYLPG